MFCQLEPFCDCDFVTRKKKQKKKNKCSFWFNNLSLQYHGSFSLRHWLRQSDWLPTLEATLALDEESVRKVGEETTGGPAVSRQLRLIRILMRDLLIGVFFIFKNSLNLFLYGSIFTFNGCLGKIVSHKTAFIFKKSCFDFNLIYLVYLIIL